MGLFSRKPRPTVALPPPPRGLADRRIVAIGDVHGCDDLLAALLDAALEPVEAIPPLLVFLGDYVDRGSGSRRVIEMLIDVRDHYPDACFLMGNHEEAMLRFLAEPVQGASWLEFGGRETLTSYNVASPRDRSDEALVETQAAFQAALPARHLDFLAGLENTVEIGDFFFVHAGVRPDVELDAQSGRDLRWIRDTFLKDARPLAKVIVHGHTPAEAPYIDHRRVGVDTGAYATGVLTALEVLDDARGFLQARRIGSEITISREPVAPA
jgi:serine/threonine protein phosphatase 1